MTIFLTVLHVLACLFLIVVVLLQRGKGAEMGAMFGAGAGSTVFGSRGAANFLTRLTTAAAVVFMLTSLSLAYLASGSTGDTLFEGETPAASESPAFGEPPAAPGAFEEVPAAAPTEDAAKTAPAPAPEPAPAQQP